MNSYLSNNISRKVYIMVESVQHTASTRYIFFLVRLSNSETNELVEIVGSLTR